MFSDLLEHELGDIAKYAQMVIKRKKINNPNDAKDKRYEPTKEHINELKKDQPLGWVEEKELKSPKGAKSYYWCYRVAETLNVVIDDYRYDYGVGGIHGSISNKIARSNKKYILVDADVSSYYPNMAISNNVYPEHLGTKFCSIYEDMYKQRKSYDKKSAENAMLKLALNGVYGDSNNQYSPFYDPQYTMSITINGQLLLCMLSEALMQSSELSMIQINTDGATVRYPRRLKDWVHSVCQWWEQLTGLQLECAEYKRMWIRDCNNYIAEYVDE